MGNFFKPFLLELVLSAEISPVIPEPPKIEYKLYVLLTTRNMFRQSAYGLDKNIFYGSTEAQRTDENARLYSDIQVQPVPWKEPAQEHDQEGGPALIDHERMWLDAKKSTNELANLYYQVELKRFRDEGLIQPFMEPYAPEHNFAAQHNPKYSRVIERMAEQLQKSETEADPESEVGPGDGSGPVLVRPSKRAQPATWDGASQAPPGAPIGGMKSRPAASEGMMPAPDMRVFEPEEAVKASGRMSPITTRSNSRMSPISTGAGTLRGGRERPVQDDPQNVHRGGVSASLLQSIKALMEGDEAEGEL